MGVSWHIFIKYELTLSIYLCENNMVQDLNIYFFECMEHSSIIDSFIVELSNMGTTYQVISLYFGT